MKPMKLVRPHSPSEKATRTTVDTVELAQKLVSTWRIPPCQREIRLNAKVQALAEELKRDGGVIPGIITLGVLDGVVYLVDGQHRLKAFELSGCEVGYADVRTHYFTDMAALSEEFVKLNSALVRLKPDDIMRGMEASVPQLARLRKRCPFVGYDMIRRSEKAPVLSMSAVVRVWVGSRSDVPTTHAAQDALKLLSEDETSELIEFLGLCFDAWSRSHEYVNLWKSLNLMLCAWLYRRTVVGQGVHANTRWTRLTKDQFKRGLHALSADSNYLDYLHGRLLTERDRSPAYDRLRRIIGKRVASEGVQKVQMPQPAWAASKTGRR